MPLTAKHKSLLETFEKRQKDLKQYLDERGENITAEDLAQAKTIKAELVDLRKQIDHEMEVGQLKGDVEEFRSYLERPKGVRGVVGSTSAGSTEVALENPRRKRDRDALRMIRQAGDGLFNKEAIEAIQTPEYKRAFVAYLRHGERTAGRHFRTLEVGLDAQGGYLAPVETIARLIERSPTPTSVQDYVSVLNTSRDAVSLPKVNYTGASDDSDASIYSTGFRVTMTDENPTSDTQARVSDTNLFGSINIPVFTWMIEGALTNNMVEDAMFDPLAWMQGKFVETVRLLRDNMILNGTGSNQPTGLLAAPGTTNHPAVVVTGSASAVTALGVIGISESLPEQYDSNARFVYKKTTTGRDLNKLLDGQNRPMFGLGDQDSGLVPGRNRVLRGYPITWSQFMPNPGSNTFPIVFGDLMGYALVNRVGFSVQVLREIQARRNQVILLGRLRFGGLTLEPWRLLVQKCST